MTDFGTLRQPGWEYGQAPCLPGMPAATSGLRLFGPRAVWRGAGSWVWIADTGQHRVLGLAPGETLPRVCLGQPDLEADAANAGGAVGPNTLYMPVGICRYGKTGMAVADSWNHRVLIWHQQPETLTAPPDLVLGQADMHQGQANRGAAAPAANTLFWPSGLYADDDGFVVADAGNRRVLIWREWPSSNGQPADQVLGQPNMQQRDQNAGGALDARGMVWPHAITRWQGDLVVADAGCSRVMCWAGLPDTDGAPCLATLGQGDSFGRLHNRGHSRPAADTLAMPYGLTSWGEWLLLADTANSRLLGWRARQGGAQWLHGQVDFEHAGDNRWSVVAPDSVCWPYGLHAGTDSLLVADTGNNRVLHWQLPGVTHAG